MIGHKHDPTSTFGVVWPFPKLPYAQVLDTDLTTLGTPTYLGWKYPATIYTAGGIVVREQIEIEVKVVTQDGKELTPWMLERCVVVPVQPGIPTYRLSDQGMRDYLYFAIAPGNVSLYIAQKKNGIVSQLPVE
jgi:hypothetical protein